MNRDIKIRILYLIPDISKGGAERLALDICNELQKRENILIKLVVFDTKNEYTELSNTIDYIVCPITFKLSILNVIGHTI